MLPLTEASTAEALATSSKQENAPPTTEGSEHRGGFRPRRKRGPPEDGVPSKTKVMVANLPYEYREDQVCPVHYLLLLNPIFYTDHHPHLVERIVRGLPT